MICAPRITVRLRMAETAPDSSLANFDKPINALVVGTNSVLGRAFADALVKITSIQKVHAWARTELNWSDPRIFPRTLDFRDEKSIINAAASIEDLHLVIVAIGIQHNESGLLPEKSLKALNPPDMLEVLETNTVLPALIAKHTMKLLSRRDRTAICCTSARVGSISDNHLCGWYSYRASKAALNQIIKTLKIELRRTHPDALCIGSYPGTVETRLSQPFNKTVEQNKVFTADRSAANLMKVIDQVTS